MNMLMFNTQQAYI